AGPPASKQNPTRPAHLSHDEHSGRGAHFVRRAVGAGHGAPPSVPQGRQQLESVTGTIGRRLRPAETRRVRDAAPPPAAAGRPANQAAVRGDPSPIGVAAAVIATAVPSSPPESRTVPHRRSPATRRRIDRSGPWTTAGQ